jgi:integrase
MLNDAKIRALGPSDKDYKVNDSPKLWVVVTPKGSKIFRYRYTFAGKDQQISIGKYPLIKLAEARSIRDGYDEMLAHGINPSVKKRDEKIIQRVSNGNTFEKFAEAYLKFRDTEVTPKHLKKMETHFKRYIYPSIGDMPLKDIKPMHVVNVVDKVVDKKLYDTAGRTKMMISQVFKFAVSRGVEVLDPVSALPNRIVPKQKVKHHASIIEPKKIGELLKSFDKFNGSKVTHAALMMTPLVFVRPGELRRLKWSEINLEEKRWYLPASKAKSDRDLVVPLSKQVIKILDDLKPITGKRPYVFAGPREFNGHMSENTINKALKSLGWDTQTDITGHGFRAMARTVLSERLGFEDKIIELQISHKVLDHLGRTYNRTEFIEKRTEMMQKWADYLDELKAKE